LQELHTIPEQYPGLSMLAPVRLLPHTRHGTADEVAAHNVRRSRSRTGGAGCAPVVGRADAGAGSFRGIEIAPEILPHVFDRFFQGRRTLDRAEGGLGIGLALVRNFAKLRGPALMRRAMAQGVAASSR
jgi:hypothetical protein